MRIRSGAVGGVGTRFWALVLVCVGMWVCAGPAQAARNPKPRLSISALSGRADLISGGSALVAINLPRRSEALNLKVTLGGKGVKRAFAFRADGRYEALLTGLRLGGNVLQATLKSGWAAKITLVNHPNGGPVFSGPQLQPWVCPSGAVNQQCDQPPKFTYVYMSTSALKHGFQSYDPSSPPSDVAQTTTDRGVTVPFIVRVETGYMDRDQYQIATLYQPAKPWTTFAPQSQFNHKLLITHGAAQPEAGERKREFSYFCVPGLKFRLKPERTGNKPP